MIRYEERASRRRSTLTLVVVCAVLWVGLALTDAGPGFATIVVNIVAVMGAVLVWSVGRYTNIRVTDSELRVGRLKVRLADLYPGVSQPGEVVEGKLAGGQWGATASTAHPRIVALTRRDGQRVIVSTKDPDAFRAALDAVLAEHH